MMKPNFSSSGGGMKGGQMRRHKPCTFCGEREEKERYIDFKDPIRLRKYVTERGKILPRRISGNCAVHQRELTLAIKRCRDIALLPYMSDS